MNIKKEEKMDIKDENKEAVSDALDELKIKKTDKEVVMAIFDWAKRMAVEFGAIVIEKNGKQYDWGQALCREQFGPDWINHMNEQNISMPSSKDLERALEWEKGNQPDWVQEYQKRLDN